MFRDIDGDNELDSSVKQKHLHLSQVQLCLSCCLLLCWVQSLQLPVAVSFVPPLDHLRSTIKHVIQRSISLSALTFPSSVKEVALFLRSEDFSVPVCSCSLTWPLRVCLCQPTVSLCVCVDQSRWSVTEHKQPLCISKQAVQTATRSQAAALLTAFMHETENSSV